MLIAKTSCVYLKIVFCEDKIRLTDFEERPVQQGKDAKRVTPKINIAVVGAGRVGVMLAEELANNPRSAYRPCCFIDIDLSVGLIQFLAGNDHSSEAEK